MRIARAGEEEEPGGVEDEVLAVGQMLPQVA